MQCIVVSDQYAVNVCKKQEEEFAHIGSKIVETQSGATMNTAVVGKHFCIKTGAKYIWWSPLKFMNLYYIKSFLSDKKIKDANTYSYTCKCMARLSLILDALP